MQVAKSQFRGCLKLFMNGHICAKVFSFPIRHCIVSKDTVSASYASTIDFIEDRILSDGIFQVWSLESNQMPKTFPNFEQSNALSKFGQGLANSMFRSLQSFLYFRENSS